MEGGDTELGDFFDEGRVGGHGQTVDIHQNDCAEVRVLALDSGRFRGEGACRFSDQGDVRGGREFVRQCGDVEGGWTFIVTPDKAFSQAVVSLAGGHDCHGTLVG